jgi:hypothetical protein
MLNRSSEQAALVSEVIIDSNLGHSGIAATASMLVAA